MALFIVVALGGLVLAALAGQPLWRARRRRRLRSLPLAEGRRAILRRLPFYQRLPPPLQRRLQAHLQVFLAEKRFVGCAGLTVTELMRVTIGAQACLLLLGREADYFPELREILVYPAAFVVERLQVDALGLHTHLNRVLSGESSAHGQVVLSWDDARHGAAVPDDGRNVVIHEFAHQLDQEFGHANGAPQLARREDYARWAAVLSDSFARLQARVNHGLPTLLDAYAASDPAEFFAVACEVFFERPAALATEEPALYAQLGAYFGLDPRAWG